MQPRLDYKKTSPEVYQAMLALEAAVNASGLEAGLLDLVRLRASQLNGCAFCIELHWKDLRARGESEQRLYSLDAWRETPFYSPREQAAAAVSQQFTEPEWVQLKLGIVSTSVFGRSLAGSCPPRHTQSPWPADEVRVTGRENYFVLCPSLNGG